MISAQCSEYQSEKIQPSAGKRRQYYDSLKVAKCLVMFMMCTHTLYAYEITFMHIRRSQILGRDS
jgi:hypothetical protein